MATKILAAKEKVFEWIDIVNPNREELKGISEKYRLHEYTLRDCLEPDHLPKYEVLENANFIIIRMLIKSEGENMNTMQEMSTKVAIFFNAHFIITIHRLEQPFLEQVKTKQVDSGRCKTTTQLVTNIIWYVLHSFEQPGYKLAEEMEFYESTIFLKTITPNMHHGLYFLKRKASICKKLVTLTEDVINCLRSNQANSSALQDVKDLNLKLITMYDQTEEGVQNLLNIYISLSAQKTNEVVKVLTIFSVFFMPLTFIVGIYGMNFDFMPELKQTWGYPAVLGLMALVVVIIYLWFKRKKWL